MAGFRFVSLALLALILFGIAAAADHGPLVRPHNWAFFGPAPVFDGTTRFSGRIDVAVRDPLDPNVMYVAGSGGGGTEGSGIWKTTNWLDANPTWQPLIDDQPSLSIFGKSLALFPGPRGGILYAAAQGPNGGILRSADGGRHWKYLASKPFANALFGAIAVSPADANTVYAAAGGNSVHGLYRSRDGGKSWANITDPGIGLGAATDVVIDPDNASVIYTGIVNGASGSGASNGGIYKSTDGGDSWTPMVLPLPMNFTIGSFIALRMAPSDPDYVYATVFDANNSKSNPELQRFSTTNGGASWNLLTLPNAHVPSLCSETPPNTLQDFRFWHVVLGVDPTNPDVVYANACEPTFVVSQDGGMSWKEISNANDDVVNAFFDDAGDLALVGDRGIHLSTNPLSTPPTFSSKQGNLGNFLIHTLALDPKNPSIIDAVVQDQLSGIQFTGTTWNYLPAGSEVGRFLINPINDNLVYTWGFQESGIFLDRSEDGGQTWQPEMKGLVISDFEAEDEQLPYNAFTLDPDDPAHLVLGGVHVWQATDEGPSQHLMWSMISTPPSPGNQITAVAVAPGSNGRTIYAGTVGGQFFVTTNGGGSWSNISPQPSITDDITTAIVIDPENPARLFINTVNSGTPGWELSSTNPPPGMQIWVTANGGASWTNIDGDLPSNFEVHTLAADFAFRTPALFAGTDRGVFWSRNLGKHWTILTIDDMEFLPQTGVLGVGTFGRGVWEIAIPGGR
jgi:photosystem II stability/assembly factor-like uncharacterized protein